MQGEPMFAFVPPAELNRTHAKAKLYLLMVRIRMGLRRVVVGGRVDFRSRYSSPLVQEIVS